MPDFSFEHAATARGFQVIAGVDEAGRGPLFGCVTASSVILPDPLPPSLIGLLDDSKVLSAKKRRVAEALILEHAKVGIGSASVEEINATNILLAAFLAMRRAVAALPLRPDYVLVDGNQLPGFEAIAAEAVVKGDSRSLSIAAASIIAKEHRDREMAALALDYPQYGLERHAGYGTSEHLLALKTHGPTPHHRRSFAPVRNIIAAMAQG